MSVCINNILQFLRDVTLYIFLSYCLHVTFTSFSSFSTALHGRALAYIRVCMPACLHVRVVRQGAVEDPATLDGNYGPCPSAASPARLRDTAATPRSCWRGVGGPLKGGRRRTREEQRRRGKAGEDNDKGRENKARM